MSTKLFDIWFRLSSSLWFIPALMVALSIGLWYGMIQLDGFLEESDSPFTWIFASSADGVRALLAAIAGSIITVAGVVFSITIVVLSQSAAQFGPQLVKSFMQDKSTQLTLGIFSATFVYSLLTLGSVRGNGDSTNSQAATALAVLLSLASIGILIRFIHNMARSVQSNRIIAGIIKEMGASIGRVFPASSAKVTETDKKDEFKSFLPDDFDRTARPVLASSNGFIQAIDLHKLLRAAEEKNVILKVRCTPGGFVSWKSALVSAGPVGYLGEDFDERIRKAFVIGDDRTAEQDIEFSIERLSMIAVRALSPSINDPYTASICIRWLGVMLCRLAGLNFHNSLHFDKEKKLRVITEPVSYGEFLDAAFNEIRHSAASPMVFLYLLENIGIISEFINKPDDYSALMRHAGYIEEESRRKLAGHDLQKVKEKFDSIVITLNANRPGAKQA